MELTEERGPGILFWFSSVVTLLLYSGWLGNGLGSWAGEMAMGEVLVV